MENAMNEKFDALKQIYSEQKQENIQNQLPATGPMTPGQVYAKNVNAVVAVNTRIEDSNGVAEGSSSGFIISADGYVVTNYHVIEGAKQVTVIPHGAEEMTAKVIGADATNDIALLKVEGQNLPFVTLGSSDTLKVGDQVA